MAQAQAHPSAPPMQHEKPQVKGHYNVPLPLPQKNEQETIKVTKTMGLIKAWEESEKTKVENKANKKFSNVGIWECNKQASIQDQQRKYEAKLDKKKAYHAEKMKNKMAEIHKEAEEKRMFVEAAQTEGYQKVQAKADNYRATGYAPRKTLSCFNS